MEKQTSILGLVQLSSPRQLNDVERLIQMTNPEAKLHEVNDSFGEVFQLPPYVAFVYTGDVPGTRQMREFMVNDINEIVSISRK